MKALLSLVGILVVLFTAALLWCRSALGRRAFPCPARFSWLLENPFTEAVAGSALLLDRLEVTPGMRVLDAGCGPGRVSIPAARRVAPDGEVVALDVQAAMLEKLQARAAAGGVTNIQPILGGIGQGLLAQNAFDRALLVTVLGETPDREATLREIYGALKPGGILSITEVFPDPHYQPRSTVRRLGEAAGFRLDRAYGNWFAFTMNFVKPDALESA